MQDLRQLKEFARVIRRYEKNIQFTMLEIGAAVVEEGREPFYSLLEICPGSRIIGFEVEAEKCRAMNVTAPAGVSYFPVALGRADEKRAFHETRHGMCASLYKPNEALLGLYQNFEVAYLKSVSEIDTRSLDSFAKSQQIVDVDFIKIDVQGAEREIFQGGNKLLDNVVAIVSEVEFVPLYIDQPLFGDVCAHLSRKNLMFHKFLGMAGRTLRPTLLNGNPNFATQHLWSDAVFITHVQKIPDLPPRKMAKLAMIACLYGSIDVSFYCLQQYDRRQGTRLLAEAQKAL